MQVWLEYSFKLINISETLKESGYKMERLCGDVAKGCEENSSKSIEIRKTQDWEIEMIGEFLLRLFHHNVITIHNNFIILKHHLREEFRKFLDLDGSTKFKMQFLEQKGTPRDLGSLLFRTNFLINTPRGSKYYQIRSLTVFQYGNKKLKAWDERRQNCDNFVISTKSLDTNVSNDESLEDMSENDPAFLDSFQLADDAKSYPLEYQGSTLERTADGFSLSSMGCFVCLQNFSSTEDFEEHVLWHGEDSDFESLKVMKKLDKPFFTLTYAVCKNSHYFCFSLSTSEQHVIIDKIIIVKTRSMFYVNNNRVPYEFDHSGVDKFFVDSHLFNVSVEQPIIIVFRYKSNEAMRIIEQHHFMRAEEFPEVNFSIKANRLPNRNIFKPKLTLLQYLPSDEIKQALKQNFSNKTLADISTEFGKYAENNKTVTSDTIIQVWNLLLQIEDMEVIKNFELFVQRNVEFRSSRNEYSLQIKIKRDKKRHVYVENILSQYDEVLIIPENSELSYLDVCTDYKKERKMKVYHGIVERVSNNRVVFLCHQKLSEKVLYKVIFRPARLTMRYQYRALELLRGVPHNLLQRYFFPVLREQDQKAPLELELNLFNSSIADNCEQLTAVRNILQGPSKNAPYIIFGPPGTGKTTTIVEAILQLYENRPTTKILVTAGSNSACDEIALRLCKVLLKRDDNRAMVRIYAKSNEKRQENIDEELLEASNMYGAHFFPTIAVLHEYRIVICTLSVVGRLATGSFGRNERGDKLFTHTFVDEVAASTATEVLVGIVSTISPINHLIIAGDHKQLGPVLQSNRASELGLSFSLMEHLLAQVCYRKDEYGSYNSSIQTRLRRNHRSHSVIVDLYNELYYENELIPLATPGDVDLASKWHFSPNPHYPIIFHSVFGKSVRGKSDVSLYNDKELEVVLDYVKDLMCFGINGERIKESDIGIISPYRKQYLRIQEELNSRRLFGIETGSVEIFQGREKPIIIVSFVRSFTDTLGFLDNPRRLNVTLSRAKSILIMIGNPKTLSNNPDFKQIIERCKNNKTMVGATLYDDSQLNVVKDNESKKMERSNVPNNGEVHVNDQIQQRKKKSKGKNKNKNARTSNENNNKNVSNEVSKLGKQMKKSVNTVSQKKQSAAFHKFKNLVESNSYICQHEKTKNDGVEDVFNSLPRAPFQSLQAEKLFSPKQNDELEVMEKEIHEKMRKLRLKVPEAKLTTTDVSLKKTDLLSNSSNNSGSNITAVSNSNILPSKSKIEYHRYSSANNNLTNSTRSYNLKPNTANVQPSTITLNDAYLNDVPLNLFPNSNSVFAKPSPTKVTQPTNVSQMSSSKEHLEAQQRCVYNCNLSAMSNDLHTNFFSNSAKPKKRKESSCILA